MNIFEIILINFIFIFFPLTFWLLYQIYSKTLNLKKSNILLDIVLFTSLYLIIKFEIKTTIPFLLFNIPLIIAYMKKRDFLIVILSSFIIAYYNNQFNYNLFILIIEYIAYYLIYIFITNKNIKEEKFVQVFVIIKMIMFIIRLIVLKNTFNFSLLIIFVAFYLLSNFVIYLLNLSEEILQLHLKFCELEHQKDITNSLFQITHEIKNPIAVCKGYLDMFDVNNIEHSRKYIPILKNEINKLLILLQDFLSINKIKIDKDIIDINLLFEEMLKSFSSIFKKRNIKCNFEIKEEEFYILADYNRLSQVLMNLIKNSMEAISTDKNGIINLYMKNNKSNVKIYIEDNGKGISKEDQKNLKSPFFTTKPRGTGLGVYLCNEIIKAHDGQIRYISKEDRGTKVIITLPYNKKDIKNFS